MPEQMTRVGVLMRQKFCPVCGKPLLRFHAYGPNERSGCAAFRCGSSFATYENNEFQAWVKCPSPSYVAASALEAEFRAGQVVE